MRAVVACIVAVAACGGARSRPTTPPTLALIEPGAEPRHVVRYTPRLHAPERAELRIKARSSMAYTDTTFQNGKLTADLPTVLLVARLEVTEVTPAGDALISYAVEDTGVLADVLDPRLYQMLEPEIAALEGLRGSWRRSPTGVITHVVIDPEKANRAHRTGIWGLTDAVLQMSVQFPDAPIGVGALWRASYDDAYANVQWRHTVTYRLKELTDGVATIECTFASRAPSQALSVEPNASQRLTSAERNVTKVLVVPLDHITSNGEGRETIEANLLLIRGRERLTAAAHMEILTLFKTLPSPGTEN